MTAQRESWKLDGQEIEVRFRSSPTRYAILTVDACLARSPLGTCGAADADRCAVDVDLASGDIGDDLALKIAPIVEYIHTALVARRERMTAQLSSEELRALARYRRNEDAKATLLDRFFPSGVIAERQDAKADGGTIHVRFAEGTATKLTANAEGIVIKTAPLSKTRARRVLQLLKKMGALT